MQPEGALGAHAYRWQVTAKKGCVWCVVLDRASGDQQWEPILQLSGTSALQGREQRGRGLDE